ncbi:LysE family translocator [Proteus vulgaris]|uniref:LysE family translocator n=1 Tax=Proteus vulgaris TaxID=585 RepID=UPI0034DDC599
MLETSLVVFTIALLGMISPGPDFFLVVKNAARYQRSAAMMTAMGIVALLVHMSYCVAGIAVLITTTPWLFSILKYAGAIFTYYGLVFRAYSQNLIIRLMKKLINIHKSVFKKAFMQGFLCNLLNPKATLFFLAVFTQVLSVDSSIGEKLWYAFIIWGLAVVYWPLLVLLIQSAPVRKVLNRVQKSIDKVLGVVLIGLGIKVALS